MDIGKRILKREVKEEHGYVVLHGEWKMYDEEEWTPITWTENLNGVYIGQEDDAEFICVKHGIVPEVISDENSVCQIGFCEKDQKWYGWSHRAIHGFGVGDVVDSEDHLCANSGWIDEYLEEHPEHDMRIPVGFKAETLEDAKRMAIAFADAVG